MELVGAGREQVVSDGALFSGVDPIGLGVVEAITKLHAVGGHEAQAGVAKFALMFAGRDLQERLIAI